MALRVKINPEKIPDREQPLSIYKLIVSRGGKKVLNELSLELGHGEILGIVGANGSGKTTLVETLSGTLDVPSKNIDFHHVLQDGSELMSRSTQKRYYKGLHCVFEGRRLFSELTVKENLEVALYPRSANNPVSRIGDLIELFPKLEELLNVKAADCTAGQQQIVAIARAIVEFPSVLILDEPTLGLSPEAIDAVAQVLKVLVTGSVGIIVLEQHESFINQVADRRLVLLNGKLSEPIAEASRAAEWKPQ